MEGDLAQGLLEALDAGGVALFPSEAEVESDCDCIDYAMPCAHAAAVHHLVAEALEGEPLLLFALRGRPREQLIAEFRRVWGDTSAAPQVARDAEEPAPPGDWFASPEPVPAMVFRFQPAARSAGMIELGPLAGDGDVLRTLDPLYQAGGRGRPGARADGAAGRH